MTDDSRMPEAKTCNVCGETKPLAMFFREKQNKADGRYGMCKACKKERVYAWRKKNREAYNGGAREWRLKNWKRVREYNMRRDFGMTSAEYDAMLKAQGGVCAICGDADPKGNIGRKALGAKKAEFLHVDHDHETGKVRGLLCANCNKGLGNLQEDVGLLLKAIEYLTSHKVGLKVIR